VEQLLERWLVRALVPQSVLPLAMLVPVLQLVPVLASSAELRWQRILPMPPSGSSRGNTT
jgi:hypothetical protein